MKNKKSCLPLFVLLFLVGAGILLFGLLSENQIENAMLSGFCVGFGFVILSFSIIKTAQCLFMTDADYKKSDIEFKDERNALIREKAAWSTVKIIIPIMSISAFILVLLNNLIGACILAANLLAYSICILAFSYFYSKRL